MNPETWNEFSTNTTLHGLRQAVSVRPFWRRLVWITCLLAGFVGYLYFLGTSIRTYAKRPVSSEITYEHPENGIDFPVVTVCNLNRFMKFKIDMGYNDERFYKLNLNMSVCGLIRGVSGNLTCGQALLCAYEQFGVAVLSGCNQVIRSRVLAKVNRKDRPFNTEEFLTRYGHDFAPMFIRYCRFSREDERCGADDWHPVITHKGICYSFSKTTTRKVRYYGGEGGLSIILDAQTDENTYSDFSLGFRVILTTKDTMLNRARGFNVFPGSHALVTVHPQKYIRLPSPYATNCSERFLPGFKVYTRDGCLSQCVNNLTIDECGCRLSGRGGDLNITVCSIQDRECIAKVENKSILTICQCNVPCRHVHYERQISYSKFPDITVSNIFRNHFKMNKSLEYQRNNLVFLQIGFVSLSYKVDKQFPSYGPGSLFGDIGGNMGLLLGCSMLTVVEFLDYALSVILSRLLKKSRNSSEAGTPRIEDNRDVQRAAHQNAWNLA